MQLEVWQNITGAVKMVLAPNKPYDFAAYAADWTLVGYVNVIPASPQLASMEIEDDSTDTQGSNPED